MRLEENPALFGAVDGAATQSCYCVVLERMGCACVVFRRKRNRIADYDYTADGVYFLTVCAADMAPIFGGIAGENSVTGPHTALTDAGGVVANGIARLPQVFSGVMILHSVIMPNHVHLLLQTKNASVSISALMNYFKGYVSRRAKGHVWQKSFYDHVVRNEADFQRIWTYIENNPGRWTEDKYFIPE